MAAAIMTFVISQPAMWLTATSTVMSSAKPASHFADSHLDCYVIGQASQPCG